MYLNNLLRDWREARSSHNKQEAIFLSTLVGGLETLKKTKSKEIGDQDVLNIALDWKKGIVSNLMLINEKFAEDYYEYCCNCKRLEEHAQEEQIAITRIKTNISRYEQELEWINRYLPAPLTEEEVDNIITDLLDQDVNNLGKIMKYFSSNYKGRYDGKQLSKWVKERLR